MRVAIYSAIIGGFDSLKAPAVALPGVDFVCFVDKPIPCPPPWEMRVIKAPETGRRLARRVKLLSHRYMPHHDVVIWLDGSFRVRRDVREAAKRYLRRRSIAVRVHPWRKPPCAYAEAKACMEQERDTRAVLRQQIAAYKAAGFPARFGMIDSAFLIRQHTEEVVRFNEEWWKQLSTHSCRDQVSFPFVVWKTGTRYEPMPNNAKRSDRWVEYLGHGQK